MNARFTALASAFTVVLTAQHALASAQVTVDNLDEGTGQGFDDPSPRSAVGGNTGTTLGEQRLIAFRRAAEIWSETVTSSVEIIIEATMAQPMPCDAVSATLGQANAADAVVAPNPSLAGQMLVHPIALANALAGQDLDPGYPDITAQFNPALDTGCNAASWYYGLDGLTTGEQRDFLETVLHELGHGLGFTRFTDASGEFVLGAPDVFSIFAFDATAQKAWIDMTASERLVSEGNARNLLWNGPNSTREAPTVLDPGFPVLSVSPVLDGLSGRLSEQVEGPKITASISGPLVIPDPPDGCTDPVNAAQIIGSIALVDPLLGGCAELQAVSYMEAYGARAVISIDPTGFDPPNQIVGRYDGQIIPAVQVIVADGELLKTAAGRTVTLSPGPDRAGAAPDGRVYLYASDPYLEGSTASHWDPAARRNLLMEPTDSPGVDGVDLTRYFMQDIGWPVCGDGTRQNPEECDDGNFEDHDGCSPVCKKEVCGDGTVNQTSEECDDGNTDSNDGCSATCTLEVCGDGTVNQTSEECDDGNTDSNDGCSATCTLEVCGDGTVNQSIEECDDGNSISGDGCEADCTITPGTNGPGDGGVSASSAKKGNDDGGCGCRFPARSSTSDGASIVTLALLYAVTRRRREGVTFRAPLNPTDLAFRAKPHDN